MVCTRPGVEYGRACLSFSMDLDLSGLDSAPVAGNRASRKFAPRAGAPQVRICRRRRQHRGQTKSLRL